MTEEIAINQPMVLVPLERYETLLKEAGEEPAPRLAKEIARARMEFHKGKTVNWKSLRRELRV